MQAELLIRDTSGDRCGSRILDSSDLCWTIGRCGADSKPDIVFQSRFISRNHGRITFEPAGFWQYTHATTARHAHLVRNGQSLTVKCGDRVPLHDHDCLQLAGNDHSIYFMAMLNDTVSHSSNPDGTTQALAKDDDDDDDDPPSNVWGFLIAIADQIDQASGAKLVIILLCLWSGIILAIALKRLMDAI